MNEAHERDPRQVEQWLPVPTAEDLRHLSAVPELAGVARRVVAAGRDAAASRIQYADGQLTRAGAIVDDQTVRDAEAALEKAGL